MSYQLFLARKLSLGTSEAGSAPAVKVAVVAVALSIAVMLASLAIVRGFKAEITQKVRGFNSDLLVYPDSRNAASQNVAEMTPEMHALFDSQPYIERFWLEVSIPGILKTDSDFKGIYFKGYSSDADTLFLHDNLIAGRLPDFSTLNYDIMISRMAANQLDLNVGDTINTYFISDKLKVRPLVISGVYDSHFDNYDELYVYGPAAMVQQIAGLSAEQGTSIHVMVRDFSRLEQNAEALRRRMDMAIVNGETQMFHSVDSAMTLGGAYFSWLNLLDTNVAIILVLMTIVSLATLISGTLIIILDKRKFIGVMKALGCSNQGIGKVFLFLSMRIAAVGMIIGNIGMLALLYLQKFTHFIRLDASNYYIDYMPVSISAIDIILLNVGVAIVIMCVLMLPVRFVSRISPEETMRYE